MFSALKCNTSLTLLYAFSLSVIAMEIMAVLVSIKKILLLVIKFSKEEEIIYQFPC
jgi:hypothetical protein